ncbi:A24 family peptidase [Rahnella perminowiae]|uniref:prepilin peptidase n=1 Tax=Rahnella perminowiae TaxID=2816244 RepID=UPI00215C299C|nr:A24 family peptidase [Rahnella perminowiae]MCR8998653.1 A24 family peptidase [Rahnella perminowiae]MCR8998712.1 A24 family peptidase [Rahnella perminowiae]
MLEIITAVILFSLMLAFNLPSLYQRARLIAATSCESTALYPVVARVRPWRAMFLLCGGVLPVWMQSHDWTLALFVLLLGSAAYIDSITRWVPDVLIFLLSWVALTARLPGSPDVLLVFAGVVVMLIPVLTFNLIRMTRAQLPVLASGDVYVLAAVGAWLTPQASAVCLALSFVLTTAASRFLRGVPFITLLYPVFVVVWLCGIWS